MSTRSGTLTAAALVSAVLAFAGSGCARPGHPGGDASAAFQQRAVAVHQAWQAVLQTPAGQVWRNGIVPLEDLTIPPAAGFDPDTSFAFAHGWYETSVPLPTSQPEPGTVTFPGGTTRSVRLESASVAYQQLDKGDPPCRGGLGQPSSPASGGSVSPAEGVTGGTAQHTCAVLTVTGATLGATTLRTSRGATTVPAWLFTVAGLPAPIARAALLPEELSPIPDPVIASMGADGGGDLVSAMRLTAASDRSLSFIIGTGACSRNPRPLVYETPDAIVIAGAVETTGGPCIGSLALQPVTTALDQSVGNRVVLSAVSGRPMPVERSVP